MRVTYDDYNDDMVKSKVLKEQVKTLPEYIDANNMVKGSLQEEGGEGPCPDFSSIEFYAENAIKLFDINSTYIDQLLGINSANNQNVRTEIEKAFQKLKKPEVVKEVYRSILNAIDNKEIEAEEDILVLKRQYLTRFYNISIEDFANTEFQEERDLHTSAVQFEALNIPNFGGIIYRKQFDKYQGAHPDEKSLRYGPQIKRQWKIALIDIIIPLDNESR